MCFFKKKKKKVEVVINSKFKVGDSVKFRDRRDELTNGYVYDVHQSSDGVITYDIQKGGECPVVIEGILEEKVIPAKR